jgi:hypothetical protein
MQVSRLGFIALCVFALLLSVTAIQAAPQNANFVGTWALTMNGGGQGGGSGEGGGGEHQGGGGGGTQALTITQNGDKFQVSHKTKRGEKAYDAVVSGNTISWTEEHQGRDGNAMKVQYKATLNGDALNGTIAGGQFNREFTAKRSN